MNKVLSTRSTLALLVPGISADDANHALAAHDFAFAADSFN
jgi:hypothetical protein